ncbi:MAG: DUF87 domain-containing protein [Thermoplasmata archaeon]
MDSNGSLSPGERAPRSWTFRPGLVAEGRGDDAAAFRARLTAAVRAGHAVGASFRLTVESGADPILWLEALDPSTARWATRAFTSAYGRHQWQPAHDPEASSLRPAEWMAVRSRDWPEPFRSATDAVATVDAVVLALGAVARGVRCQWRFVPAAVTHRGWWEFDEPPFDPIPRRGTAAPMGIGRPRPVPPDDPRERPLFWNVSCSVHAAPRLEGPAVRALESATRSSRGSGLRFRRRRWWQGSGGPRFHLTEAELVLALPTACCPATGVPGAAGGGSPPMLPLGRSERGRVIGPTLEPDQGRHLAVLGETGMGKSSLLRALARRVVDRSGLILFDPLGETARSVRDALPLASRDRLVWIEPGADAGLNALEGIGPPEVSGSARGERLLNDLVHALRRVRSGRYVDSSFWGPRLEEMLTRALRAAAAFPAGTLVDAHLLLASGGRGFRVVPPEATVAVRELGDRIRSRPEDAEGARRLLYEVVRSPTLVRMVCRPQPSFRASDLVAPGKVVLVAGNAAEVGESTARYLLSVYLALVWSQLLARPRGPKTFVVLDEAQWFVHESLSEMLRLGRRQNVHVVLATQAIASLPEAVAEAVWTNVADFVAFRGSPEEAREFSRVARGVPTEAILSLPRGEAAVLLGKGNVVEWVRVARPVDSETRRTTVDGQAEPGTTPETARRTVAHRSAAVEVPRPRDPVEVVLFEVRERVRAAGTRELVRVSLSELRRASDPTDRGIRAAGGLLGRSGALVRTVRDRQGTFWWIDPDRILETPDSTARTDVNSDSPPTQPS